MCSSETVTVFVGLLYKHVSVYASDFPYDENNKKFYFMFLFFNKHSFLRNYEQK